MEGPIEFQPTKANLNHFETTHPLEVLQDVTLIQKRPQLSEGKFNFIWYTYPHNWYSAVFSVDTSYTSEYQLFDYTGNQINFLKEESSALMRCFCFANRSLEVSFQSNSGDEIFRLHKPYTCWFSRYIEVYQKGSFIGKVQEVLTPCSGKFVKILDSNSETLYNISGPSCLGTCFSAGDIRFDVRNEDFEIVIMYLVIYNLLKMI